MEHNSNYLDYLKYNLTYTIYSLDNLLDIVKGKIPIKSHIKFDTGLNRLGINNQNIDQLNQILKENKINIEGIFTHIADSSSYMCQISNFNQIINQLNSKSFKYIHVDSSRFIENDNNFIFLRIGIKLYSYKEDALSLYSPIIRIKEVKKDELVGYHKQEKAPSKGYLITIPLFIDTLFNGSNNSG